MHYYYIEQFFFLFFGIFLAEKMFSGLDKFQSPDLNYVPTPPITKSYKIYFYPFLYTRNTDVLFEQTVEIFKKYYSESYKVPGEKIGAITKKSVFRVKRKKYIYKSHRSKTNTIFAVNSEYL